MLTRSFAIFLLIGNVAAFAVYALDKSRARRGAWRISEKTLLLCGFLCGAAGALAAMQLLRHKTRHTYFYAINFLGLAWQVAALIRLAANGL